MNLWIGGIVDDQKSASGAERAVQTAYAEFWPGPILDDENPPSNCNEYDRLYRIVYNDDIIGQLHPSNAVLTWPTHLGAKYENVNKVDEYQPRDGDRPLVFGDEMLWWLMNDRGNSHLNTRGRPVGVEVRTMAYAFGVPGTVGNTTFYRYEIKNRNSVPIDSMFVGWKIDGIDDRASDPDNYMGTDTTLSLMYIYNSDADDIAYGSQPPAIGVFVLENELKRSSGAGYERRVLAPEFTSTIPIYPQIGTAVRSADDMYTWLNGQWPILRHLSTLPYDMREGGDGGYLHPVDGPSVSFMYPGDPINGSFWSMMNTDGNGHQARREYPVMLGSVGPVSLQPNDIHVVTIAIVWAQGQNNWDSVRKLRDEVAYIRSIAPILTSPRSIPKSTPTEPSLSLSLGIFPNPFRSSTSVSFSIPTSADIEISVFDVLGRQVGSVADGFFEVGTYTRSFDASELTPGVYYMRFSIIGKSFARSIVVM
ncbi:MAG: T9SS type A sorting domain-containing protein [Rhodothermales bacterium]